MIKQHTRRKRNLGINSRRFKHRFIFTSVKKKNRPKTFSTEKMAHEHAKTLKLKENEYVVIKAKKNKRFQIKKLK